MKEISRVAGSARSAGMSYGRFVAAGRGAPRNSRDEPLCADCPQCSRYNSEEGPASFCHYSNRPIEPGLRTSPAWCWLRSLRG
jgi:hypothetical protein